MERAKGSNHLAVDRRNYYVGLSTLMGYAADDLVVIDSAAILLPADLTFLRQENLPPVSRAAVDVSLAASMGCVVSAFVLLYRLKAKRYHGKWTDAVSALYR